jgi:hypothetical protein
VAREAQIAQLTALDSLDGKCANLIAFAGIVLGLVFSSSFATEHWTTFVSIGAGILGAGTLPLAAVLLRARPRLDPAIGPLADVFLPLPASETDLQIVRSIAGAIDRNEPKLHNSVVLLRIGAGLIIAGLILVAASLIYSHVHHGSPPRPTQLVGA